MSAERQNGGASGTSIAALAAAEALVPKYDVAVPRYTRHSAAPD
jgi:hypothetical protein